MEQEPNQTETVTMAYLTEEEKGALDIAPDGIFKTLFDSILDHGAMPAYFALFYKQGETLKIIRYEGREKVLAALDYIDHLIATGKIADPYE